MNNIIEVRSQKSEVRSQKSERNDGIDLLRMLAMFFIVMIHVLGYGGVRNTPEKLSAAYNTAWLMNTAAYSAVNCYALISGYAGLYSRFRYSRLIALWFRVAFYTVSITAIFSLLTPEAIGYREWLKALFPVIGRQYWYFTAYFALFPFMPVLNSAVCSLPRKTLRDSIIGILFMLSFMQTLSHKDIFGTSGGFSMLWLMAMYIAGAYFRRYGTLSRIGTRKALCGYVLAVIAVWVSKLAVEALTLRLVGTAKGGDLLTKYTSPAVVIEAVCLLAVFSRMSLASWLSSLVKIFAPMTFSVYLIHLNRLVLASVIQDKFSWFAALSPALIVAAVLSASVMIYLCCSFIDVLRVKVFHLLRVSYISELAEKILERIADSLCRITMKFMSPDSGLNKTESGQN